MCWSPAPRAGNRSRSGTDGFAFRKNTTGGCRPDAARRRVRATSIVTNRRFAMKTHVVSAQQWEAARQQMLVKEKDLTRARDALAAERPRVPWQAVEKTYEVEGPAGKASLGDLFDGRRQLIVYRAFF